MAKDKGWDIEVIPNAKVKHIGGHTMRNMYSKLKLKLIVNISRLKFLLWRITK